MAYHSGDHKCCCQRCGFVYRRSQMRREWNGLWVCRQCWEPKHPQLDIKARHEKIAVDNPMPEPEDNFIVDASDWD